MTNADEPFLSRWSRRKAEARREPPADDALQRGDEGNEPGKTDATARPADSSAAADRPLTEADFADFDFDKLDSKSDYARFMQAGVPQSIRQKALRKLWESDPVFNVIDPLQDYAGDFTDKALAVPSGMLRTAYKVGQGFLTDEEAAEWDRLGKPAEKAAPREIVVAAESPDQPEVREFLSASDAYMAALYPAESNHLVDMAALKAATVRFLVARRDGTAIGCGAIVLAGDGSAEIKRMWVTPEARGSKVGRAILEALEATARAEEVRILRLETGVSQPEALALYRQSGFTECPPFGSYAADPLSLFMEKRLD